MHAVAQLFYYLRSGNSVETCIPLDFEVAISSRCSSQYDLSTPFSVHNSVFSYTNTPAGLQLALGDRRRVCERSLGTLTLKCIHTGKLKILESLPVVLVY